MEKAIVEKWLAGCQAIVDENMEKMGYAPLQKTNLEIAGGRKYIKIIAHHMIQNEGGEYVKSGGGSAWAFIDTTNGDVLKPASWKAPAKHARGNLFDANKGLGWIGPHGPAYLK